MKIIHIVENLDKGAVENWLVKTFIESRKYQPNWHWSFYCILGERGKLDTLVHQAGGEIIYAPVSISHKISFLIHLRKTLKAGHYDILHAHHDYLSGFYLLASTDVKFSKRILHIHNTDKALPVGNPFLRRILLGPFKKLGFYFSDIIVGISNDTLHEFVGSRTSRRLQFKILYYGVDLKEYEWKIDPHLIRSELRLPATSKILLFVGRMNLLKNPVFVVDVLANILTDRNDVYAVFVGKGDLEDTVEERARYLKISEHVRLLGWCNDSALIFKSADVFIFPRIEYPKEGLGLVVVEAQAAGIPMVISRGIVPDAIVVEELAHVIPLENNPKAWASKILEILNNSFPYPAEKAFERIQQSPFELGAATKNLLALYEE